MRFPVIQKLNFWVGPESHNRRIDKIFEQDQWVNKALLDKGYMGSDKNDKEWIDVWHNAQVSCRQKKADANGGTLNPCGN